MKKYIEPKIREIDLDTEGMIAESGDGDVTPPESPEIEITPKSNRIWKGNEDWLNK